MMGKVKPELWSYALYYGSQDNKESGQRWWLDKMVEDGCVGVQIIGFWGDLYGHEDWVTWCLDECQARGLKAGVKFMCSDFRDRPSNTIPSEFLNEIPHQTAGSGASSEPNWMDGNFWRRYSQWKNRILVDIRDHPALDMVTLELFKTGELCNGAEGYRGWGNYWEEIGFGQTQIYHYYQRWATMYKRYLRPETDIEVQYGRVYLPSLGYPWGPSTKIFQHAANIMGYALSWQGLKDAIYLTDTWKPPYPKGSLQWAANLSGITRVHLETGNKGWCKSTDAATKTLDEMYKYLGLPHGEKVTQIRAYGLARDPLSRQTKVFHDALANWEP